jgi:hypothetical protein
MQRWKSLAAAAVVWLATPLPATADQVEEQLKQMQQRMTELENKLQATNDELQSSKQKVEQQEELIHKAGIQDELRGAGSGAPAPEFFNMIQVDGFVAASWNYNFHRLQDDDLAQADLEGTLRPPSTVFGENQGALGITAPGFTNTNSFQLDQLWFGIGKPATMESNAGFRADIVYGAAADANREGTFFTDDDDANGFDDHGTGDLPHIFQAYAEYLAPVGANGISVKAGRFATPIGAESFRQDSNFFITRGANWALQPVNHTGVSVGGHCDRCSMDWMLGVVNGYSDTMSDRDNGKGFLGSLKYSGETFAVATNVYYGGDIGDWAPWFFYNGVTNAGDARSGDKIGVADLVVNWNPTDRLSTWANYDYYWTHNVDDPVISSLNIHTFALASRYGVTDRAGVALRGEYQMWNSDAPDISFWTITGTFDYALTENLIVKLEGRYDIGKSSNPNNPFGGSFFISGDDGAGVYDDSDQVLGLVQMMYKF